MWPDSGSMATVIISSSSSCVNISPCSRKALLMNSFVIYPLLSLSKVRKAFKRSSALAGCNLQIVSVSYWRVFFETIISVTQLILLIVKIFQWIFVDRFILKLTCIRIWPLLYMGRSEIDEHFQVSRYLLHLL